VIRHVVMFRWEPEVDASHVSVVASALDAMVPQIPSIRAYTHGRDLGVNVGNHDYVVVADFDDVDGYIAYRDHPVHKDLIASDIAGLVAERAAIQFEVGG
jgi:hypothetical protein